MAANYSRTAVLLFTLSARAETIRKASVTTRLGRRRQRRGQQLWDNLQQLAVAKIQAAGLPCLRSATLLAPPEQTLPFGRQLRLAATAALQQGYDRIIVIGNDCPSLHVADLRAAADTLAAGGLPLGFDQRGGVFLFGLDHRFLTADHADSFEQLPWQTAGLGAALHTLLQESFGRTRALATLRADWNEATDVRTGSWLAGAFAWLTGRIGTLLDWVIADVYFIVSSSLHFSSCSRSLRAPPALG
ncbi:hypothetical protein BN8_03276 [Fibrisoma limi BUZ 3]|uniref:DUF2064 domain-containing protein n=1 Tax=Fibrisoma limi BUZ 3 TaxID=1185876 RepID=I2GJQ7_9BACT|nr:DUF2064 domain-containing protein [Fibrisoma limi]CCH54132.1 hypothetical protein BN8_03276 [Fibrisoma limi BUZ 3]